MDKNTVLLKQCAGYVPEALAQCAKECLEHVDPDNSLVTAGRKVLLKVNMLSAKEPEKAVTTHPEFVRAVVLACRERGADVQIGDSPAGPDKGVSAYWDKTGYREVAESTGSELVNFESAGSYPVEICGMPVHISNALKDADTVINLPKLKTHGLTMMTGAVKNMYGSLPGFQKGALHARLPRVEDFSRLLVELYKTLSPSITIMDAIVAMDGNGPAGGDPRDLGLVLAATNAVALDLVAARIMGFNVMDVPTNKIACAEGLADPDGIEIAGDASLVGKDYGLVLPANLRAVRVQLWIMNHLPSWVFGALSRLIWILPEMTDDCVKCGKCIEGCPKDAISVVDGRMIVDSDLCIVCLRCQEVCESDAVKLRLSFLARLLLG